MRVPGPIRAILGLRQTRTIAGVRYTELTTEPLARAMSRRGSRQKAYAVVFPSGRKMRICATPERTYADLMPSRLMPTYARIEPLIRPGQRVLACRAGTGDVAEWISHRVGPSGAVVALDDDEESVRYARSRYPLANTSHEVGFLDALAGEVEGSFDGVALVDLPHLTLPAEEVLGEFWRLVAPRGWLMLDSLPASTPGASAEGSIIDTLSERAPTAEDAHVRLLGRICEDRQRLEVMGGVGVVIRSEDRYRNDDGRETRI